MAPVTRGAAAVALLSGAIAPLVAGGVKVGTGGRSDPGAVLGFSKRADAETAGGGAAGLAIEEEGGATYWQGVPVETIDPSRYPEFLDWLNDGPAKRPANSVFQASKPKREFPKWNDPGVHFPTLDTYMDTCQSAFEGDEDSIVMRAWMGRMGNKIWQFINAIRLAQASGRKYVKVPLEVRGFEKKIFALEPGTKVPVEADETAARCDFIPVTGRMYDWHHDCRFNFFNRCRMTVQERQALYLKYVAPLLKQKILSACEAPDDQTVTLHIRNGDVALHNDVNASMRAEHRQPPCAYYHDVISRGRDGGAFTKIQMLYSDEPPESPCIQDIIDTHKDKEILKPSGKLEGDTCMVLKAKNLATTMSSFSTALKMMNTGLERLFFVNTLTLDLMTKQQYDLQVEYYEFNMTELCEVFPKSTSYSIPELYKNAQYFLAFPPERIVQKSCEA